MTTNTSGNQTPNNVLADGLNTAIKSRVRAQVEMQVKAAEEALGPVLMHVTEDEGVVVFGNTVPFAAAWSAVIRHAASRATEVLTKQVCERFVANFMIRHRLHMQDLLAPNSERLEEAITQTLEEKKEPEPGNPPF